MNIGNNHNKYIIFNRKSVLIVLKLSVSDVSTLLRAKNNLF